MRNRLLVSALGVSLLGPGAAAAPPAAAETTAETTAEDDAVHGAVSGGIYLRYDTDTTRVISPRAHFRSSVGKQHQTNLDITYSADVWTSASIDIRTSATKAVTEQRDEINVGFDKEKGTTAWGMGYRFSHEPDYIADGLSLFVKHEAFQRNTTLEGRVSGNFDLIGRSGDQKLGKHSTSFSLWLGWTQLLGKRALMQLSYELRPSWGYLSSPYRFVSIGGAGGCAVDSPLCLPEVHPGQRQRHAAVLRGRYAPTSWMSLGAAYRFYADNWRLFSHTAMADLSFVTRRDLLLVLDYRFYSQGDAFFYQSTYSEVPPGGFLTRDRELSKMGSNRISARLEYVHPLGRGQSALRVGGLVAGTRYHYAHFVGLERVNALEVSLSLGASF